MAGLDAEIDQLYQGPLSDFTANRNALAKRAGARAGEIRSLQKPSVAAWAINQLFWSKRPVYDALIERADDLRATHAATVRGRRTDLRGASKAHEDAIEAALKSTLALLADGAQSVTDATRQAISTTLRSLPGDEPAGRLTRQLQPRGFEMLAGAASAGRVRPPSPAPKVERTSSKETAPDREARATAARLASAREAAAAASRDTREAEQLVRREEFEAARAARDLEKAERRLKEAEEALEQAESEARDARKAASGAIKARDGAQARASRATEQLKEARAREDRARGDLGKLT